MKAVFTLLLMIFVSFGSLSQTNEEKRGMAKFPPLLLTDFPAQSLGSYFQQEFEAQAKSACGIERGDKRLYIPNEIVNGYQTKILQETKALEIPISANNLLFLALTKSDTGKLNASRFDQILLANKVVGVNDNLILFGEGLPSAIQGFPSRYYQKSCASYFDGNLKAGVKLPMDEMKSSLEAESKKQSIITSVTGRFFSPLSLILNENSERSVYAHLVLWSLYVRDAEINTTNQLINNSYYIDELEATLINRSTDQNMNASMTSRVSAGFSGGAFSVDGTVNAGHEQSSKFSLKDFRTFIHLTRENKKKYTIKNLPGTVKINSKLQSAVQQQQQFNGFASHLVKFEFTRQLSGVPSTMCEIDSWVVENFDDNLWVNRPKVISKAIVGGDSPFPKCLCEISGFIKKTAIDNAISGSNSTIDVAVDVVNKLKVNNEKLTVTLQEPSVRVTKAPTFYFVDENSVNASSLSPTASAGSTRFNQYTIKALVDDTELAIANPVVFNSPTIEFVNTNQSTDLVFESVQNNGKSFTATIKTKDVASNLVLSGETVVVPIKFKVKVKLAGTTGPFTEIVTNTINVRIPVYQQVNALTGTNN